jgi:hypothetical protein
MSLIEKIKDKIVLQPITILISFLSMTLLLALQQIASCIWPAIKASINNKLLWPLLTLSVILNILLCAFVLLLRPKFKLKFGVYWNRKKDPYCSNCEIPLSNNFNILNMRLPMEPDYICQRCKGSFYLQNMLNNRITPEQALKEL